MTRSAPSRADVALIDALADRGLDVSPYQLERWRTAGLLPRNNRRPLGRGKGSTSELDDVAVELAARLAEYARQGRAMPGSHIIECFAKGQRLEEDRIREAFHALLDRISRKLAVDAGKDDQGWQARYDAARRTSRNSTPVNWQELIDAFNETPSRPDPSPSEERAAVRTMFRTIADATETTADELLHAFGIFGSAAGLDVEQMISAQREAELAGTDNWEALGDALSLHRYREILNATSIEDLQRSAVAVFTVTTLQGMIVFMGMWPVVAMRTGAIDAVPPNLSVVGPAVVKVMTNDPVWQQWGAFQTNVNPRSTVLALAMSTLGIFMLPGFLANVEAYSDRLQRLALQLTATGRATEA